MSVDVHPADAERWDDVATVFAGRSVCWCQRFRRDERADDRAALAAEIASSAVPIGLVAYRDSEPAGWSRVVPRGSLPGVAENRALQRLFATDRYDGDEAWWISCFAVLREHRGAGVGGALLHAAAEFARAHGASVLDGHPVDVERLSGKPSPAALFTGTRSTFVTAGFVELGPTYPSRPVMRLVL